MNYATLDDLARAATNGWAELAQRACRDARVDGALLRAVATSGDVSAWSAEAIALAQAGVVVLADEVERVSRYADTFLVGRYAAVLPLSAGVLAGTDLPTVVATIAVRRLYGHAATEEMLKATRWADDYLRELAAGRVSLGVPAQTADDPEVRYSFSERQVTDDTLRGFA
ncbi:MAG: hypothetical protein AzoDbin1_05148 [Azoarcus sp.]|nr:hypothetical protein [Azoarcus sp.]